MTEAFPSIPKGETSKRKRSCLSIALAAVLAVLLFLTFGLFIASDPYGSGSITNAKTVSIMYTAQTIAIMLHDYATDHHGQYPTGKSSTEIFQKLIDENYATDPGVFLGGFPRSSEALEITSNHLKPINVGFDLTSPIEMNSPNDLPLVFLTGYRVDYSPGASASPLSPLMKNRTPLMAMAYKNMKMFSWRIPVWQHNLVNILSGRALEQGARFDGTIPNFVPTTFNAAGKHYQQLTPTGPLTP